MQETLLLVIAIATCVTAVGVTVISQSLRRIPPSGLAEFEQVDTHNEGTVGSFANEDETRRIEGIERSKRTPTEQRHLDSAPLKEPEQGEGV